MGMSLGGGKIRTKPDFPPWAFACLDPGPAALGQRCPETPMVPWACGALGVLGCPWAVVPWAMVPVRWPLNSLGPWCHWALVPWASALGHWALGPLVALGLGAGGGALGLVPILGPLAIIYICGPGHLGKRMPLAWIPWSGDVWGGRLGNHVWVGRGGWSTGLGEVVGGGLGVSGNVWAVVCVQMLRPKMCECLWNISKSMLSLTNLMSSLNLVLSIIIGGSLRPSETSAGTYQKFRICYKVVSSDFESRGWVSSLGPGKSARHCWGMSLYIYIYMTNIVYIYI